MRTVSKRACSSSYANTGSLPGRALPEKVVLGRELDAAGVRAFAVLHVMRAVNELDPEIERANGIPQHVAEAVVRVEERGRGLRGGWRDLRVAEDARRAEYPGPLVRVGAVRSERRQRLELGASVVEIDV